MPELAKAGGRLTIHSVEGREELWRQYVNRHACASLYQRLEFRQLIEQVFGHRCHYFMALAGDQVRGVLPLVEMKSRLFGHFFVSLPFFNYGGMLAEDTEAQVTLADQASQLAAHSGASHIEMRQAHPLHLSWTVRQHKAALIVPIQGDPSRHWSGLSSRLRGKVRKAGNNGATFSTGGAEYLPAFYSVFTRNMRDLGTPTYSRRLFEGIFQAMPGSAHLFVVHVQGRPVAGAFGLRHGNTLELPWICSNYDYSRYYVNEFLYWSVLEWACARGLGQVDLGRSSIGSGPYRFKQQWNPQEQPLYWYYWTAPGMPVPQLNPQNPRYDLAIRCWQKLPLRFANIVGPHIVRSIP